MESSNDLLNAPIDSFEEVDAAPAPSASIDLNAPIDSFEVAPVTKTDKPAPVAALQLDLNAPVDSFEAIAPKELSSSDYAKFFVNNLNHSMGETLTGLGRVAQKVGEADLAMTSSILKSNGGALDYTILGSAARALRRFGLGTTMDQVAGQIDGHLAEYEKSDQASGNFLMSLGKTIESNQATWAELDPETQNALAASWGGKLTSIASSILPTIATGGAGRIGLLSKAGGKYVAAGVGGLMSAEGARTQSLQDAEQKDLDPKSARDQADVMFAAMLPTTILSEVALGLVPFFHGVHLDTLIKHESIWGAIKDIAKKALLKEGLQEGVQEGTEETVQQSVSILQGRQDGYDTGAIIENAVLGYIGGAATVGPFRAAELYTGSRLYDSRKTEFTKTLVSAGVDPASDAFKARMSGWEMGYNDRTTAEMAAREKFPDAKADDPRLISAYEAELDKIPARKIIRAQVDREQAAESQKIQAASGETTPATAVELAKAPALFDIDKLGQYSDAQLDTFSSTLGPDAGAQKSLIAMEQARRSTPTSTVSVDRPLSEFTPEQLDSTISQTRALPSAPETVALLARLEEERASRAVNSPKEEVPPATQPLLPQTTEAVAAIPPSETPAVETAQAPVPQASAIEPQIPDTAPAVTESTPEEPNAPVSEGEAAQLQAELDAETNAPVSEEEAAQLQAELDAETNSRVEAAPNNEPAPASDEYDYEALKTGQSVSLKNVPDDFEDRINERGLSLSDYDPVTDTYKLVETSPSEPTTPVLAPSEPTAKEPAPVAPTVRTKKKPGPKTQYVNPDSFSPELRAVYQTVLSAYEDKHPEASAVRNPETGVPFVSETVAKTVASASNTYDPEFVDSKGKTPTFLQYVQRSVYRRMRTTIGKIDAASGKLAPERALSRLGYVPQENGLFSTASGEMIYENADAFARLSEGVKTLYAQFKEGAGRTVSFEGAGGENLAFDDPNLEASDASEHNLSWQTAGDEVTESSVSPGESGTARENAIMGDREQAVRDVLSETKDPAERVVLHNVLSLLTGGHASVGEVDPEVLARVSEKIQQKVKQNDASRRSVGVSTLDNGVREEKADPRRWGLDSSSPERALFIIGHANPNRFFRLIARTLLRTGVFKGVKLEVINDPSVKWAGSQHRDATGQQVLSINLGITHANGNDVYATILHEAFHVALESVLDADPKTLSKSQVAARRQLEKLHEVAGKAVLGESWKTRIAEFLQSGDLSTEEKRKYYGFTNLHEFVSETMTNREFQKLLNGVPVDNRTALRKFFEAALALVGFDVKRGSAFEYAAMGVLSLLEEAHEVRLAEMGAPPVAPSAPKHSLGLTDSVHYGDEYTPDRLPPEAQRANAGTALEAAEEVARRSQSRSAKARGFKEWTNQVDSPARRADRNTVTNALKYDTVQDVYAWAKETNRLIPKAVFDQKWKANKVGEGGGAEHQVYYNKATGLWVKKNDLSFHGGDLLSYLQRVSLHNYLFPESAMTLVGFVPDGKDLYPVVTQKDVPSVRGATQPEVEAFMKSLGYRRQRERDYNTFDEAGNTKRVHVDDYINADGSLTIGDLHSENAVITKSGDVAIIDPDLQMTPEGKRSRVEEATKRLSLGVEDSNKNATLVGESKAIEAGRAALEPVVAGQLKTLLFPTLSTSDTLARAQTWLTEQLKADPTLQRADEIVRTPGGAMTEGDRGTASVLLTALYNSRAKEARAADQYEAADTWSARSYILKEAMAVGRTAGQYLNLVKMWNAQLNGDVAVDEAVRHISKTQVDGLPDEVKALFPRLAQAIAQANEAGVASEKVAAAMIQLERDFLKAAGTPSPSGVPPTLGQVLGDSLKEKYTAAAAAEVVRKLKASSEGTTPTEKANLQKLYDVFTKQVTANLTKTPPKKSTRPSAESEMISALKQFYGEPRIQDEVLARVRQNLVDAEYDHGSIDAFIDSVKNQPPITRAETIRALRDSGISISDLVKQHWATVGSQSLGTFAERLIREGGLTPEQAHLLSARIEQHVNSAMKEYRKKALAKLSEEAKSPAEKKALTKTARLMQAINMGMLSEKTFYNSIADTFGLPTYDAAFIKDIERRGDEIQRIPVGEVAKRNKKTQDLYDAIQKRVGFTNLESLQSYWYASVLSGLGTQTANFTGGFSENATGAVSLAIGEAFSGDFSAGLRGVYAAAKVMAHTLPELGAIMFTGDTSAKGKAEVQSALNTLELLSDSKNPWVRGLSKMKYVGRAMTAADLFNASLAKGMRLGQLAKTPELRAALQSYLNPTAQDKARATTQAQSEGYTTKTAEDKVALRRRVWEILSDKVPPEVMENANAFALEATYNNELSKHTLSGKVGTALMKLQSELQASESRGVRYAGVALRHTLFPFIRIAANLTDRNLDYTPAAFLFRRTPEQLKAMYGRDINSADVAMARGKAVLGSLLLLSLFGKLLAMKQEDDDSWDIHGSGPKDPAANAQWKAAGNKAWTIRIGHHEISFQNSPLMFALGPIGALSDRLRYSKGTDKGLELLATAYLQGTLGVLKDSTFLSQLSKLTDLADSKKTEENFGRNAVAFLSRPVTGLIPRLTSDIETLFNPERPDLSSVNDDGIGSSLLAAIASNVPVVKNTGLAGKPALNMFGEPLENRLSFVERAVATLDDSPLWSKVVKLQERGVFLPTPSSISLISDGEGGRRKMTREEFYEYKKAFHQEFKTILADHADDLLTMSPEEASSHLRKLSGPAKRAGREAVSP